ncbi:methyl-accepting chemotaxis protein [Limisphaera sp. 4302-co]|uniref:methyl-accepting chemotaxis protein n=1 Tax=Limisphaera sp. 4302-co TaxID=3400417 RepID=UPI003C286B25
MARQSSIPRQLLTLIGLALSVTVLGTAVFFVTIQHLLHQSRSLSQTAMTEMQRGQQLIADLAREHSLLQALLREKDLDRLEQGLESLQKVAAAVAEQVNTMTGSSDTGSANPALREALQGFETAQKRVLDPLLRGNNGGAYEIFLTDYTPNYEALLKEVDSQMGRLQAAIEARITAQSRAARQTALWSLTIMAVLVVGVAALAWRLKNRLAGQLKALAQNLHLASEATAVAADHVSSSSQSLAQGASEQAASLEETSASLEELTAMTQRNAANAQQARQLASQTRTAVEAGQSEMSQLTRAMDDIQTASAEISKIIKTIDEIAFQTNLLALNAAVEAARAGEAGMGFAVVADEVRALAQRAAAAARETAEKIENSVAKSRAGADISQRVAQHLQDILTKARHVDELVAEIAAASQEQSQGIGQINAAVSQMDKVTQANAAAAEQSAAAARELQSQADALREAVVQLQAMVGASGLRSLPASTPTRETEDQPVHPSLSGRTTAAAPTCPTHNGGENDLNRQVTRAMAAHNAWKQRLAEAIRTGRSDFDPAQVAKDNQCEFGKWLYSAPAELRQTEHWQQVRSLHAEFHKEAARVLELALAGRRAEAQQSLEHGGSYARCSAELITALKRWKQGGASNGLATRPAVDREPVTVTTDDLAGSFVDDPIPMPPPDPNPVPRFRISP